jgi:guanine deaminase
MDLKRIKTNIISTNERGQVSYDRNVFVSINGSEITEISSSCDGKYEDLSHLVCLPGFIDTHIHLAQNYARGYHGGNLLEWLEKNIFPEELKTKSIQYANKISSDFFHNLLENGTTTSVVYTSVFSDACDTAFSVANKLGVRAVIGKVMMDQNSPSFLQETEKDSLKESIELFEKWNLKTPLLEYVFTPRFAPTCSRNLMKEIGRFASQSNAYIQTHLSENFGEIAWVNQLFPTEKSYTEVYEKCGLLGEKTILAHCIHLKDEEWDIMKATNSKIAHCPDSNFFLKSGRFHIEKALEMEIPFALASDVGAGTEFSMLYHMKMENYMQLQYLISPEEAFFDATFGAAKVLSKQQEIGSIEINKQADLQFRTCSNLEKTAHEILSNWMYCYDSTSVEQVYIAGKKVYSKE